jgi:hypothetical protein
MKTPVFNTKDLVQGDFLFYGPKRMFDLVSQIVMRRTAWGYAVHVEIFHGEVDGQLMSTASRNGIGVNLYSLRTEQLISVRRAKHNWNYHEAFAWFLDNAKGQGYDFKGLMCFTYAVQQGSPNKMFCSEYATRFARKGDFHIVNYRTDADTVSPNDLDKTLALKDEWRLK